MKAMEINFYQKKALHLKGYSLKKARLIILLFLVFQFQISKSQTTKRVYFIGNSVTDAINYGGVDAIAESKGNNHIWARHMIPGAPLSWLWTHPNDGFYEQPFGYPTSAFKNYEWDAISLQPFDRGLDGTDGDVAMAGNYINLAKGKSPNVQIYIYSRWPRKATAFPENASGWNTAWTQTYNQPGGANTNETKDYFEKLVYRLRTTHSDIKPILMVPVGQVFHALNQKMAAGQVPGYANIWQVYSDGIHLTSVGAYIAAVTFYSTMYKADPRGTVVPSQYGTIGSDLASVIQQTAWEVVAKEVLSGVSGAVSTPPTASLRNPENPSGTTGGLDYSYFEGTWTSLPDFSTLKAAKTGNANSFDLTVRNRDDNFAMRFTGYIDVPSDGDYSFYTSSDDGSKLFIGTREIVNNDGLHAATEKSGSISLRAGKHAITVSYFEATGGELLTVQYEGPGINKQIIPASRLFRVPPTTAVNNPPKAIISANPTTGAAPLNVAFSASGSIDPDAGDFILGYEWNFGDGSALDYNVSPTHVFNKIGTYTVTLKVMDNRNLYSSPVTTTITVSSDQPTNNGLKAEYFNNRTLASPAVLTRTDGTVNFDWGSSSPSTGTVNADDFSVRWTGQVEAPVSGSYTFSTTSDDGVRLWVNGVQVINNWTNHASTTDNGTSISLAAGQKYNIRMEFYEATGGAVAKLLWAYAGQIQQVIPQNRLFPSTTGDGTGSGLRAEYFNNIYLTSPASLSRTDATVNFDWGISAPASGVNVDHFSVRWTGQVEAPISGSYTFSTTSDDGIRLWVNGVQLINNWTDHAPTNDNGTTISLVAGQKYDIKMEYYERGGGAVAKLLWAFPGQTQQVIPQNRLYNSSSNLREDDSFVISNITVAPNPASEAIYVMLPFEGEEVSVTLSNSIGEIFLQKSEVVTHSLNVDLSNVTPGMYFLTIRKGNLKHVEKVFVTK